MNTTQWFDSILSRHPGLAGAAIPPAAGREAFLAAYAACGWKLRRVALALSPEECAALREAGIPAPERLSASELARAALLCREFGALPEADHLPLLRELFRTGDNAEREAALKALALLPEPGRFLDVAFDACRSSVQTTVEAITLDNAYPDQYFPPEAFRGMALKALHLGLPLARVHRLAAHVDAELARMAEAYASERRAAGRAIAADIHLLILGSPTPCP